MLPTMMVVAVVSGLAFGQEGYAECMQGATPGQYCTWHAGENVYVRMQVRYAPNANGGLLTIKERATEGPGDYEP